jgi:hypothetical protein
MQAMRYSRPNGRFFKSKTAFEKPTLTIGTFRRFLRWQRKNDETTKPTIKISHFLSLVKIHRRALHETI